MKAEPRDNVFWALPRKEQRMIIAQDVLDRLALKQFEARTGDWVMKGSYKLDQALRMGDLKRPNPAVLPFHDTTELRDIPELKTECAGCAIGGMFLCAVDRANQMQIGQIVEQYSGGYLMDYLGNFFELAQLDLIEAYFENRGAYDTRFLPGILNSTLRMSAIMFNILINDGTFNPYNPGYRRRWATWCVEQSLVPPKFPTVNTLDG